MNKNYSLTINDWLKLSTKKLDLNGIESSRLDCLLLLELALKKNKAEILAQLNEDLKYDDIKKLDQLLNRRLDNEPVAYITNKKEFCGLDFFVNKYVLIPRPESEEIISETIRLNSKKIKNIADIGCGSGCIGLSIKNSLPNTNVDLYDINKNALLIAAKNAKNLNLKVSIKKSNLLKNITRYYDLIVANLPYVPDKMEVSKEILKEPRNAIFSGETGINLYRDFWDQIHKLNIKPKFIITESLLIQHNEMINLAKKSGYKFSKVSNLIQVFSLAA
jgi:release factor glutamine methyltransferase